LLLQVQDGQLPTQALSHLEQLLQVQQEQSRHSQQQQALHLWQQQQQLQLHLGHNPNTNNKKPPANNRGLFAMHALSYACALIVVLLP
jgi:hypothetical protein